MISISLKPCLMLESIFFFKFICAIVVDIEEFNGVFHVVYLDYNDNIIFYRNLANENFLFNPLATSLISKLYINFSGLSIE